MVTKDMRIGLVLPSIFASKTIFPEMIFAPGNLMTVLSDGLKANGRAVTVFSTPDFNTSARLISAPLDYFLNKVQRYKSRNQEKVKRQIINDSIIRRNYELDVMIRAFEMAKKKELDIIHIYHDSTVYLSHYLNKLVNVPVVYTLHDPLPPKHSFEYLELSKFKDDFYIAISQAVMNKDLKLNIVATIHHGIELSKYSFLEQEDGDYLLFAGRMLPEKGPDDAIITANKLNKHLFLAYDQSSMSKKFFQTKIEPHLTGKVQKTGFLQPPARNEYMRKARLLIFPVKRVEPFGMVMIEAMACGTPVVAYARGSVPEVIKDGVTGFIVNQSAREKRGNWIIKKTGIDGLCEAVTKIYDMPQSEYRLMRRNCRKHVEDNFSSAKMVDNYEKVYQKIITSNNA